MGFSFRTFPNHEPRLKTLEWVSEAWKQKTHLPYRVKWSASESEQVGLTSQWAETF